MRPTGVARSDLDALEFRAWWHGFLGGVVVTVVLALIAAGTVAWGAPQTKLCGPCGAEGCDVARFSNAVCNGGVCRPACAGGEKFNCWWTNTSPGVYTYREKCTTKFQRHCAHPEWCQ